MSEKELQDRILELCDWLGLLAFHDNDSRKNRRGFPDLVIAGSKGTIFAELKNETRKATVEQVEWLDRLRQSGEEAYLWRPNNWEEIVGCLKRIR